MSVSPKLIPFLDEVNQAIKEFRASGQDYTVDAVRANLERLDQFVTRRPVLPLVFDSKIRDVPVRLYRPDTEKALPVLVFFHGGGHMCGSVELYDPMSRKLALACEAIVISVDYRLTPEHPYPAGIEDAQTVLEHHKELLDGLATDGRLFIAGDSAGGAICTTLATNNRHSGSVVIDKQLLIYPSVDYTMSLPSMERNGYGFMLEAPRIAWYFDQYFGANDTDRKSVSALFMPIDGHMPETLVIVAGCDPLHDEGIAYAERLKAANIPTQLVDFEDMIHAFMNLEDLVPEACEALFSTMGEFARG